MRRDPLVTALPRRRCGSRALLLGSAVALGAAGLAPGAARAQQATPVSAPATAMPASGGNPAVNVLLGQAKYWESQSRPERAVEAINRALLFDPNNPDALALMAQVQAEAGNKTAAQANLTKLQGVRPDDPRIATIQQALRIGVINQDTLNQARNAAREAHPTEAVQQYQQIFNGAAPPTQLSVEYYQTLAGTEGGWDKARSGLGQYLVQNPQDMRAQLAYAQILTYRDGTRQEGIERLQRLTADPSTAQQAQASLRQALIWLPANASSIPQLSAYAAAHPSDADIQRRLDQAKNPPVNQADVQGELRVKGFAALNGGRVAEAESDFQQALAKNADDPDASGGLGLVRMRQGRTEEARTLIQRAITLDPSHRDQWQAALNGANIGQDYQQARRYADAGNYAAAERVLAPLVSRNPEPGGMLMLADIQARAGETSAAEASYRAVIARQPNNGNALVGLGQLLSRQGRLQEADAMFARAETTGSAALAGQARAAQLRSQAASTTDPEARLGQLRAAVAADPTSPWARLDLARALVKAGRKGEAQDVMAQSVSGRASNNDLQAAIIFATEVNDPEQAASLIARLPPSARTPDMRGVIARAQVQSDIRAATLTYRANRADGRARLLAIAATPDPDGVRGAAVAQALAGLGDPRGAREAIATAQAASRTLTPTARLAYAGALLSAHATGEAQAMLAPLQGGATGLTADQRTALAQMQTGVAVSASDRLNEAGHTADAYDQLAPVLAAQPDNADANMALSRLYQTAREPKQALRVAMQVVQRDPDNLGARQTAVAAAIQAGDYATADALVQQATRNMPNAPESWVMAADLARARGNDGRALADLRQARDLRRQQLGDDGRPRAAGPRVTLTDSGDTLLPPEDTNPFRRRTRPAVVNTSADGSYQLADSLAPGMTSPGLVITPAVPADPMLAQIDTQMATLQDATAPQAQVGLGLRSRSGTSGEDRLTAVMVPMEATFSPGGSGKLKLAVTPTYLDAGSVSNAPRTLAGFGGDPLYAFGATAPVPRSQTASGVGLDVAYSYRWLSADLGSTPVGFQEQNIIGGLELAPEIAPGVRLRLTGERRAVTDSVLSYAGTKDPVTGTTWGGVTRVRGHAQLEFSAGLLDMYVGAGFAQLTGKNVDSNTEWEGGAGGSYPVFKTPTDEIRVGLDLIGFGYQKNLRYFTLGQGGYFSPQTYFAAVLPVTYTGKVDDLTYSVGGSIGYQTYHEQSSNVFPNDGALQSRLQQIAFSNPLVSATYSGKTSSGVRGGVHGSLDYKLTPSLHVGGEADYQHAADYDEARAMLYARYIFNGAP